MAAAARCGVSRSGQGIFTPHAATAGSDSSSSTGLLSLQQHLFSAKHFKLKLHVRHWGNFVMTKALKK